MRTWSRAPLLAALLLAGPAACGPIVSGIQTIKVDAALSAAKTAGASKYAIYEYTAAKEYLIKSREAHGYSDFDAAQSYAVKALKYAQEARERAQQMSRAEQAPVLPPTQ